MQEWDLTAEEELVAIEAAYSSKRCRTTKAQRCEGWNSPIRKQKGRRLPSWASAAGPAETLEGDCIDREKHHNGVVLPRNRLWSLSPHPRPEVIYKVQLPAMSFSGKIVYCRTSCEVRQSTIEILKNIKAIKPRVSPISIGFDIEWKPNFRRGEAPNKAAVMQICTDHAHCYVMHLYHSGIPPILKSFLEDASYVKVGVSIGNDVAKILNDYGVRVQSVEDLSDFANLKFGGARKRWSLCSLTETITCKELPKPNEVRLSNWESDPLSRKQLHYAATDAYVSWYLYEALKSFPNATGENEH